MPPPTALAGCSERRHCRGLGLVEILVGLALGLFLVGAAVSVLIGHLQSHRQRLTALRLTQELRGAMTLMEREVRRAGYWGTAEAGIWQAGQPSPAASNPYAAIHPAAGAATTLGYTYSRDVENQSVDAAERFGFRLNANTRTLEMRLSGAALVPADGDSWQPVTDPAQARITRLAVTVQARSMDLAPRCTLPCPPSAAGCPPQQVVRLVTIELAGQSQQDPTLTHTLTDTLRVRADALQGACPA